jgi:hypothetical protein
MRAGISDDRWLTGGHMPRPGITTKSISGIDSGLGMIWRDGVERGLASSTRDRT